MIAKRYLKRPRHSAGLAPRCHKQVQDWLLDFKKQFPAVHLLKQSQIDVAVGDEDLVAALEYMHRLGDIVYASRDMVVLQPSWFANVLAAPFMLQVASNESTFRRFMRMPSELFRRAPADSLTNGAFSLATARVRRRRPPSWSSVPSSPSFQRASHVM